ncbi:chemotaxis protein CheW [Bacillus fonticola]|uniref:chemotaxis protein CheW n=1 Tax=Bacillus fonticola TaxID=2728853 RepID=UPI0014753AD5|nr:chemotaxis protein CheW [Bacillus fonticola]
MEEARQIILFTVENDPYAVPVEALISIEKWSEPRKIPKVPTYIRGTAHIRGELMPVVDARQLFCDEPMEMTSNVRLLVLEGADHPIALLVEEAKELITVKTTDIKDPHVNQFGAASYWQGMIQIEEELVMLVDVEKLFDSLHNWDEVKSFLQGEAV